MTKYITFPLCLKSDWEHTGLLDSVHFWAAEAEWKQSTWNSPLVSGWRLRFTAEACCLNSSVEKFCKASFFVVIIQCNRTAEKLSFREVTTYGSFTNDLFCVVPVHFKSLSWDHLAISILHSSCTLNISTLRRHILLCSDKEIRWEQAVKKTQKNDPWIFWELYLKLHFVLFLKITL